MNTPFLQLPTEIMLKVHSEIAIARQTPIFEYRGLYDSCASSKPKWTPNAPESSILYEGPFLTS
jgi:hypothetical protein